MKILTKTLVCLLFVYACYTTKAQSISNLDFENWQVSNLNPFYPDTLPTSWVNNFGNCVNKTTDAYQGNYAAKIRSIGSCGVIGFAALGQNMVLSSNNFIDAGLPYISKPISVSGYYKLEDVSAGDSCEVTVILKKYNSFTMKRDTIAYSSVTLPASQNYSLFTVNVIDLMPLATPDSIIIMCKPSKYSIYNSTTFILPTMYVDAITISKSNINSVKEIKTTNKDLVITYVYPNPASENTTLFIDGDINLMKGATVSIYDALCKKVMVLDVIDHNNIIIPQKNLMTGKYYYNLNHKNKIISKGSFIVN